MNREHFSTRMVHFSGPPPPRSYSLWESCDLVSPPADELPEVDREARGKSISFKSTADLVPKVRSVLAPVDGSPFSEQALPLALSIARRSGSEVRVVYVHRPLRSAFAAGMNVYEFEFDGIIRRGQKDYLEKLRRRIAKSAGMNVSIVFAEGESVADALASAADKKSDLVVMANHRRGLFGRIFSGSVSDELSAKLSAPLLLTRGYHAPIDLSHDRTFRHVLIPLDGSLRSEAILRPATALGAIHDADHTLLRVLPFADEAEAGHAQPNVDASWDYVRRVAKRTERSGVRVRPSLVRSEEAAASAILSYARDHEADLIALATGAPKGLTRWFRGSTADLVIRGSDVPVLLLRSEKESTDANLA